MDKFTREKRSEIMSAIHSRDTLPEIVLRKWLFAAGVARAQDGAHGVRAG